MGHEITEQEQEEKIVMETYEWKIRIHTKNQLDTWMQEYLDELEIRHDEDGTSLMSGELPDMPAVYGLIIRLRDAGISLISLLICRKLI